MLRVATIAVGTKDTVLDSNLSLTNWNMGQGGGGVPALFVIGERGRGAQAQDIMEQAQSSCWIG